MSATDTAMFHLETVARFVSELVLPPDALNSLIPGILRATRPFLDTDRDCIQQNIELFQQQLAGFDALLNRIDEVRSEIRGHRDAVQKSMTTYLSTLAPIRRLPREISCAVFREVQTSLWCNLGNDLEPEPESKYPLVLDFSQGPWKLSHVCASWRDIVLSYPQLWSHSPTILGMSAKRDTASYSTCTPSHASPFGLTSSRYCVCSCMPRKWGCSNQSPSHDH